MQVARTAQRGHPLRQRGLPLGKINSPWCLFIILLVSEIFIILFPKFLSPPFIIFSQITLKTFFFNMARWQDSQILIQFLKCFLKKEHFFPNPRLFYLPPMPHPTTSSSIFTKTIGSITGLKCWAFKQCISHDLETNVLVIFFL